MHAKFFMWKMLLLLSTGHQNCEFDHTATLIDQAHEVLSFVLLAQVAASEGLDIGQIGATGHIMFIFISCGLVLVVP